MSPRRTEELALNAAGALQSIVYDGWLLGYRPGPTKRLRCVNPFYASTLACEAKIDYCAAFYEAADLPALFRLLPFAQPPELDSLLESRGWGSFDRTLVQRVAIDNLRRPAAGDVIVELLAVPEWQQAAARVLQVDAAALPGLVERAGSHPLPGVGAVVRRDGEVAACGLLKIEDRCAGLFALATLPALRGLGLGRAIVAALLREAERRGAQHAYLQVTANNDAALAVYRRFGFATAYDYWYRARSGEQR